MTTKRKPNASTSLNGAPNTTKRTHESPAAPAPDFSATAPHLAIADILEADRMESERRDAARAYDECLDIRAKMASTKSRTLTGSLLEALGLGRPLRQGGRATSLKT